VKGGLRKNSYLPPIDRSIRPLFAEAALRNSVIATVLGGPENDPDILAMLGTSVALHVSDIPFNGLAGVRIGALTAKWVMNPNRPNCH
jgi:polyribonucleotide nucleotidyltransferase